MQMVGFDPWRPGGRYTSAAAAAANGNFEERRRAIALRPLFRRRSATSDLGGCR